MVECIYSVFKLIADDLIVVNILFSTGYSDIKQIVNDCILCSHNRTGNKCFVYSVLIAAHMV